MSEEAKLRELHGCRILEYPAGGSPLGNTSSSLEIVSAALSQRAERVAIPVERLGDEFFQLRNGIAGEVLQKFVTYQVRIAIVGDIISHSDASKALHDFVVECNRGSAVWFVRSMEELNDRLRRNT
ncbi:MAG: DUF4180 domain-containing protein [Terracidiphilus sp.]|jgi:hypothetical protein